MSIRAIQTREAIFSGVKTERFLRSSDYVLWEEAGHYWCKEKREGAIVIKIGNSNVNFVQYDEEQSPPAVSVVDKKKRNSTVNEG